MGYAHIVWIYDDAITVGSPPEGELKTALGEAVFKVISEKYEVIDGRTTRIDAAPVLNHGNAVNYCDEAHSSDERLFLWFSNCLRPLNKLEDRELLGCQELLSREIKRRAATKKS